MGGAWTACGRGKGVEGRACAESSVHWVKRCGDRAATLSAVATRGQSLPACGRGRGPSTASRPSGPAFGPQPPPSAPCRPFCATVAVSHLRGALVSQCLQCRDLGTPVEAEAQGEDDGFREAGDSRRGVGAAEATFAFSGMPSLGRGNRGWERTPEPSHAPPQGGSGAAGALSGASGASTCE